MKRRLVAQVLMVALALALAMLAALGSASSPAGAVSDRLPDLRMAHLRDFSVQSTVDGRRLLRFDSMIVNVGAGKFEARGRRSNASATTMSVRQRIFNDAGGYRGRSTPAIMYFAGDGHAHWHVRDLERFRLTPLGGNTTVGTGAKHGFCFYDNSRFGSTKPPHYSGCGGPGDLRVTMGLTVGWGDLYDSTLPDQYINVTRLAPGDYRLRAVADAENWFQESNGLNNHTWVDLRLQGNRVSVIRQGPGA